MNKSDLPEGPIKKKDNVTDVPVIFCAECGQAIEKSEFARECVGCHLNYHYYCGFSTPDSEKCKSCMYKEHGREYARIKELEKKRASFGCYLLIFLFLSVIGAGIYGFGYFSGASSEFVPFIIFSLLAIVTLIAIFRNIPILRE